MNRFSHSASNTILSCFAAQGLLASSAFACQVQKAADDDPDVKEIASYTLSINKIHHVAGATNGLREWQQKNPDLAIGMDSDELKNAGGITEKGTSTKWKSLTPLLAFPRKNSSRVSRR